MEGKRRSGPSRRALLVAALAALPLLIGPLERARAGPATDAQQIVDRAKVTLSGFLRDPNYAWMRRRLQTARAVLIFPQVLKAGFIFGGSGGTGVLLVKNEKTGEWSQPAFYTIGSATFGLQIGGETAEIVMVVNSGRAVNSLLGTSVKLGGDVSVAAGPYGAGARSSIRADIFSFAKSKGLYAGINVQGSVIKVRDKYNDGYYGRRVKPADIVLRNAVGNLGARELRATLRQTTTKVPPT